MTSPRILILTAAVSLLLPTLHGSAESTPAQRLASELIRTALDESSSESASVQSFDTANLLANEATQLDPDNSEIWHIALDLAMLSERDDLKTRAVEKLSQLEPDNEQIRLMRLTAAVERFQTFEERVTAYQKLLSDQNLDSIGKPVASRLALDLALLYQRQNQIDQFSRWLSKAVEWDSSNRSAAAIATGFFRMNVKDPAAEAELLLNLIITDPTDITAQVALGQLLLEHGAFSGATRLYSIAVQSSITAGQSPATNLLVDLAVAQWASGDEDAALTTLNRRLYAMDQAFRIYAKQERPELSEAEVKALPSPVDKGLATAIAAIRTSHSESDAIDSVAAAISAYDYILSAMLSHPKDAPQGVDTSDEAIATTALEMAWVGVWLGADMQHVKKALEIAESHHPLSPQARQRFNGWLAFRDGQFDNAIELLAPLASTDLAARLGVALSLKAQGNLQQAAKELLNVCRAQPGSLIGVWSAARLGEMLKTRIPPAPGASALETLIASLSTQFDRYASDPSTPITLRVNPRQLNYDAFEPILVDIELTNKTIYPLALDRNGPLRPQVLVVPSVRSAAAPQITDLRPFILTLDRQLRLEPNQTVVTQVNLRDRRMASIINAFCVDGSILKLRALVNFSANQETGAQAGLYGTEVVGPLIRVDGERVSNEWIQNVISLMQTPGTPGMLREMALLSRVIAPRQPESATPEDVKLLESARLTFAKTFAQLDFVSQAWLLCVMPQGSGPANEGIQPTLDIAKKSEHRLVRLCYLLFQVTGVNDPMLDAAKRSDDPVLQQLSALVQTNLEKAEAARSLGR